MSLPAVDVKFLSNITRRMSARRLHVYVPAARRSAIAIVLRFGEAVQQRTVHRLLACRDTGLSPSQLLQHLAGVAEPSTPSSLRILLVKQMDFSSDRWSGNVTFPGGQRDAGDADDLHAVCREVNAMLGVPLQSREFILLGRLRDYAIRSRHIRAMGAVQARFVFLHIGEMTPTERFASHRVEAVQWMPISTFAPGHVQRGSVCHPVEGFVRTSNADLRLLLTELFPRTYLAFPSVQLPGQWHVWGLALRSVSELMSLDDRPPIDWPLVSSNSALLQHGIIDAFHGYHEVVYAYHRVRARLRFGRSMAKTKYNVLPPHADSILWGVAERVEPRHILFFCLDVLLMLFVFYCLAALISIVCDAFRIVFGWTEPDVVQDRAPVSSGTNLHAAAQDAERQQQQGWDLVSGGEAAEQPFAGPYADLSSVPETAISLHGSLSRATVEKKAGDLIAKSELVDGAPGGCASGSGTYNFEEGRAEDSGDSGNLDVVFAPNADDWDAFRRTVRQWARQGGVIDDLHCSFTRERRENKGGGGSDDDGRRVGVGVRSG